MEYTYDDIITAKDVISGKVRKEDIIGKKGWFLEVMPLDMSLNTVIRLAGTSHTLKEIDTSQSHVFITDRRFTYLYFLPEKEESLHNGETVQIFKTFSIGDRVIVSETIKQWHLWCSEMDYTLGLTGTVKSIDDEGLCRVYFNDLSTYFWYPNQCLERVSEYEPFDLSEEEDKAKLRGAWVRHKNSGREYAITGLYLDETPPYVEINDNGYEPEYLLEDYEFVDGTPCGKEKNNG